MNSSGLNISDVLDAIETTDPTFAGDGRPAPPEPMDHQHHQVPTGSSSVLFDLSGLASPRHNGASSNMDPRHHHQQHQQHQQHRQPLQPQYAHPHQHQQQLGHQSQFYQHHHQQQQQHHQPQTPQLPPGVTIMPVTKPHIEILEQPASKALRFRYECEGRSAGSIPGVHSTPENKTYPTIRLAGYKGKALVVVSCVTKDGPPYRAHPHNLVGKEGCKHGVCKVEVSTENMTATFANLGIQCVKRKDIEEHLKRREESRVDPFNAGFDHKRQPTSIDLNAVRLCFQAFIEGRTSGKCNVPLVPVVSDPIYDKKAMSDLVICKVSHCSAPVSGGEEVVLLCEKVAKEDIQVRFFEVNDGQACWEGFGDFQPSMVHKQVAIVFRTPMYGNQLVEEPVQAYLQLKRPSDGAVSEPIPFQFMPTGSDPETLKRKRQKLNNSTKNHIHDAMQPEAMRHKSKNPPPYAFDIIKTEPEERGLLPNYGGQIGGAVSPSMYQISRSPANTPNYLSVQTPNPTASPGRTPSPMDCARYNILPQQQQQQRPQSSNQSFQMLNPIVMTSNASPSLIQEQNIIDSNRLEPIRPQSDFSFAVDPSIGSGMQNYDVNDLSISKLLETDNQPTDSNNYSLSNLDNMLGMVSENLSTGLSISDLVNGI